MEISKELIEKYHLNTCSVQERAFVEAWLTNDDFDAIPLNENHKKEVVQNEMWQNISSFIDESETTQTLQKSKSKNRFSYLSKIAASVLVILTAGLCYTFLAQKPEAHNLVFNNSSDTEVKNIDYSNYSIAMAPKSNGKIDVETNLLDFCGSLLLSPKNDVELSFKGLKEKIKLKAGQTYIVLSSQCPSNHPIIVNEKDVFNLPPVIQRQLTSQFSI